MQISQKIKNWFYNKGCTMEKESIKLICEALKDKQYLEEFEIGCIIK